MAINGEKIPPGVRSGPPRHIRMLNIKQTVVGIPAQFVDQNPAIFAHPEVFDPNRWLNGDSAGLEKWVIQFGRGTRMCLGIQ